MSVTCREVASQRFSMSFLTGVSQLQFLAHLFPSSWKNTFEKVDELKYYITSEVSSKNVANCLRAAVVWLHFFCHSDLLDFLFTKKRLKKTHYIY